MHGRSISDPWKEAVRPVICVLGILAVFKAAVAAAGGSGVLLAQAVFTAAEVIALASAVTGLRKKNSRFSLPGAVVLFAAGCALLWRGVLFPLAGIPGSVPFILILVVFCILFAEIMLWLWISGRLGRLRSLAAAAAGQSCRRDLTLLVAALAAETAVRYGFPATGILVSAGMAVLILLQSVQMVYDALNSINRATLPEKLLSIIRKQAAKVAGIAAVHIMKAWPEGESVSVELRMTLDETCFSRCDPDSVSKAVRDTLKVKFRELSRVLIIGEVRSQYLTDK